MNHLKRFNEKREEEEEEWIPPTRGPASQDVSHWEIVIENGKSYLKISTDDDTYYTEVKNSARHRHRYDDEGEQ
jgi:hypothetical protein